MGSCHSVFGDVWADMCCVLAREILRHRGDAAPYLPMLRDRVGRAVPGVPQDLSARQADVFRLRTEESNIFESKG